MAVDHSEAFVDTLRFPRLPFLHALIAARRPLGILRRVQRAIARRRRPPRAYRAPQLVTGAFDGRADEFRAQRWTYVEGFFDPDVHHALLRDWPSRAFFAPPSDLLKSYDRGFEWRRSQTRDPHDIDRFPVLRAVYDELRSEAFGRRMTAFAGSEVELSCYSFLVTMTWPGSVVAPHRDTIAYSEHGRHFVNLVMFVDATGGPGSGGLSLMHDNNFRNVYFEPRRLRNTALVYDVSAPGYHGFKPVRFGKFRWAIISNFCAKDFRREGLTLDLPATAASTR